MENVYRFRPVDCLLDKYSELENQDLYLSAPSELNDPMEGYQDVVWQGDRILWENLLRHYLLALHWVVAGCLLMGPESFKEPDIPAALTEDGLPTDDFRSVYRAICDRFLANPRFSALPDSLSKMAVPLGIEGLRHLLSLIHLSALSAVVAELRARGLAPEGWSALATSRAEPESDAALAGFLNHTSEAGDVTVNDLAFVFNQVRAQQGLSALFRSNADLTSIAERKRNYLLYAFPDLYPKGIADSLIHPDWYATCFSADCTNASMWSAYADQHRGACLMFRVEKHEDGRAFIPTTGVVGISSSRADPKGQPRTGPIRATLHRVNYDAKAPRLNFFEFLGRLPRGKPMKAWYSDRSGAQSPLVKAILEDTAVWRNRLWTSFYEMATTKLGDWAHEDEYRIVVSDILGTRRDHRKLSYELSHLSGVVFGLRTATRDKLELIRRLHRKVVAVKGPDVKFYQMVYRASERRLIRL